MIKSGEQVAAILGVSIYQLAYAHKMGVPKPAKWSGVRAYTQVDVERLRDWFANRKPWGKNEILQGVER